MLAFVRLLISSSVPVRGLARILIFHCASWRGAHQSPHWHFFRVLYYQVQKSSLELHSLTTS